jgi:hypothetical protein
MPAATQGAVLGGRLDDTAGAGDLRPPDLAAAGWSELRIHRCRRGRRRAHVPCVAGRSAESIRRGHRALCPRGRWPIGDDRGTQVNADRIRHCLLHAGYTAAESACHSEYRFVGIMGDYRP